MFILKRHFIKKKHIILKYTTNWNGNINEFYKLVTLLTSEMVYKNKLILISHFDKYKISHYFYEGIVTVIIQLLLRLKSIKIWG